MLLLVDNGSIYTKNITDFLSTKKILHTSLSYDDVILEELGKFQSFILSGRRKNNKEMNAINSKIINHAVLEDKPLLGICYGAEILALTSGGTIRKMNTLQKGNSKVMTIHKNPLCNGTIEVYQSHNFEISHLGNSFTHIAKSESCNYEIIQYGNSRIFGTQFHPEMTQDGLGLIENFLLL
ncbi:type 1 glutamine amidotransferase [Candidatus Nitrosotenuis sp. DW1]|uniref:type 1 glutamine amidotransferase n=1 Tax=Candidatus Nitrosotenuis sp. DW1 TaxID=2259672 RepID=UPI0015CD8FDD|nr:gamma-glutamyl-gamma-aminobutyrate hydrolase family protein [Candidatus Nitrosotenuis sp. DW1]QLH09767.1 glutamine amidotransferase [Candidatus Nitrosotenuis sp. DW1]